MDGVLQNELADPWLWLLLKLQSWTSTLRFGLRDGSMATMCEGEVSSGG